MLVFFSPKHQLHAPSSFLFRGRPRPNPEVPARIDALIEAARSRNHQIVEADEFDRTAIQKVHSADYLEFMENAWTRWTQFTKSQDEIVAQVHPNRHMKGRPSGILGQVGEYIADANCPIHGGTWAAAIAAAETALCATKAVLDGAGSAYAACRPPGHHAFNDAASGFCILNNAAIAAEYARTRVARVAILDVDIHHGNGTQSIFYDRSDVLFVSIHRDPTDFYPFFAGYPDECGIGSGENFNLNLPLAAGYDDEACLQALARALDRIREFRPDLVLVSLGFDAHRNDPHGAGGMTTAGFARVGEEVSRLGCPTVLIQEGGYLSSELGPALAGFLTAFEGIPVSLETATP